jgi:uncharacterized membrane protein
MTGSDTDPLHRTFHSTGRFVWDNLPSIIVISVGWFLASLPIVTIGPATLGAYRAVLSLRDGDGLDRAAVTETVREQFVHATLLGLLPLAFVLIAVNYGVAYLATGRLAAGLLAVVGVYATIYVALVLVPTFVGLARGATVSDALWAGYRWTAGHALAAVVLGMVTVALLATTSALTVAVVLAFAGVACSFHVEFLAATDERLVTPPTPNT